MSKKRPKKRRSKKITTINVVKVKKVCKSKIARKALTFKAQSRAPYDDVRRRTVQTIPKRINGYKKTESGLFVPNTIDTPVPATKLTAGFANAKREIKKLINEIADLMTEEYCIGEIQLSASFSADGKFMGFGIGGATSISLKIVPLENG